MELAASFRGGQPVQIKTIGEAHDISPRFLVQILLQLKGAGLVASSRGSSGGYQLARAPDAISLADIINAIDRSPQVPTVFDLPQSKAINAVREVWNEVNREEQRILEGISLADLLGRAPKESGLNYQI